LIVEGPHGQKQKIEAIVDTGYNGSLTLPSDLVTVLGLPFRRRGRAILADGSENFFDIYEASVALNEELHPIPVDAADSEPLLGMSLLHGHELTIQVVENGSVNIKKLSLP
jgi:clan AA aspartic protease